MTQLTREEWGEVAERLGEEAEDYERFIAEIKVNCPEGATDRLQNTADALRMAAAAVLWVSENAADKVRFMMLDSHPPDRNCRQIRERGAR